MKSQLSLRGLLLVLSLSSALLAFGKVAFFPAPVSHSSASFVFPEQVPLPGWQAVSSKALISQNVYSSKQLGGMRYQYLKGSTILDVEMRYFDNTNGDVSDFLKTRTSISGLQANQQKHSADGYYRLFLTQERAYLSACINANGGSTVTSNQFKKNRNTYDIRNRLLPWLLGQGNLQDNRCLWALLSIPVRPSSPETAYQNLESAWLIWYQRWNHTFPDLNLCVLLVSQSC